MTSLTLQIKNRARELGFDKVGVARADMLDDEARRLTEWLASGFHGTMDWMARNFEKRIDPRKIMPDARSIISVAMNYYTDVTHSTDESIGKISRYAWGEDYHDVLLVRLKLLLDFIREQEPRAEGKAYVDTGPVMEKVWAERAGIGWEGKHTNIITQEYGSWVFLGEIIVNLELEYDAPATDHCGSCTLCIEACPTQAIVEPYVLDSNLCISYLTIEHRGTIAEELGEKFDRWVYGCDICQDVCPWNHKFAEPTPIGEFTPRVSNIAPGLEDLSTLSLEEFNKQFQGSPMKRTKHGGITRNAGINLKRKVIQESEQQ